MSKLLKRVYIRDCIGDYSKGIKRATTSLDYGSHDPVRKALGLGLSVWVFKEDAQGITWL